MWHLRSVTHKSCSIINWLWIKIKSMPHLFTIAKERETQSDRERKRESILCVYGGQDTHRKHFSVPLGTQQYTHAYGQLACTVPPGQFVHRFLNYWLKITMVRLKVFFFPQSICLSVCRLPWLPYFRIHSTAFGTAVPVVVWAYLFSYSTIFLQSAANFRTWSCTRRLLTRSLITFRINCSLSLPLTYAVGKFGISSSFIHWINSVG